LASSVYFGKTGKAGSNRDISELLKKIDAIPEKVRARVAKALNEAAETVVDDMKAICPTSPLEPHPGHLRESIRKVEGRHELSVGIVADAQDKNGWFYAAPVEFGHKAKDGTHVRQEPFFFPTYRRDRGKVRAKVSRATSAALKEAAG
jgi:HK97 gp10 family phage protein